MPSPPQRDSQPRPGTTSYKKRGRPGAGMQRKLRVRRVGCWRIGLGGSIVQLRFASMLRAAPRMVHTAAARAAAAPPWSSPPLGGRRGRGGIGSYWARSTWTTGGGGRPRKQAAAYDPRTGAATTAQVKSAHTHTLPISGTSCRAHALGQRRRWASAATALTRHMLCLARWPDAARSC